MFHDQRRKFRPAVARRTVNDAVRPAVPVGGGVSGDDALDDLIRALRDERGLAAATLVGLPRSETKPAWTTSSPQCLQNAARTSSGGSCTGAQAKFRTSRALRIGETLWASAERERLASSWHSSFYAVLGLTDFGAFNLAE